MNKHLNFEILKKGRVWFEALLNGHKCKIKINEFSSSLKPGECEIFVKDISVKSLYGTDLKFEPVPKCSCEEITTFSHKRFNLYLISECKKLGGRWDKENKSWIFDKMVEEEVEQLEKMYNSSLITIEITSKDEICNTCGPVCFCGYPLAIAEDRDGGARVGDGFVKLEGQIGSGGSRKYWTSRILKGAVFRTQIPKELLQDFRDYEEEYFHIRIILEKKDKQNSKKENINVEKKNLCNRRK